MTRADTRPGGTLSMSLKQYSTYLGWVILLVGVLVFLSWPFGLEFFKRPIPHLNAMNPATALCFVLTAISFLTIPHQRIASLWKSVGYVLTGVLLLVALLRIIDNITELPFQVDKMLFSNKMKADIAGVNRMPTNTAVNFLLASVVLFSIRLKNNFITIYQCIALTIGFIALFSILGQLYRVQEFYGLLAYLPMALHSAFCFFLFALAILFYSADVGLMKELTGPYAGAIMGRIFIPVAIFLPLAMGYIRLVLDWRFGFTPEFGVTILTLSIIIVLVIFIWYFAVSLNSRDRQRKNAEHELQLAYTLLTSSLESHKDVLIFSINQDYRYLNFNSAFKIATSLAYGTTISKGQSMLQSITQDDDRMKAKQNCDRALAGESHTTVETYGDINIKVFETRYNPIIDQDEKIIGVTVLSADITDRKLAEDQILALNKELEAFTYSVSHDLRAPLRSVRGFTQLLKDEYGKRLDEEGNRLLSIIIRNASQMGQLIDDLLDFARLGRKQLTYGTVNTKQLVSQVIRELSVLENGREIQFEVHPLPNMRADPNMMRQVWINLISNALKYTRNAKRAVIEIGQDTQDDKHIFYVRDNGVGFDMQYSHKLFNVFQRLHSLGEFEGTGVGLALAHRIITKHNGKIWAEAELNKGATFFFYTN